MSSNDYLDNEAEESDEDYVGSNQDEDDDDDDLEDDKLSGFVTDKGESSHESDSDSVTAGKKRPHDGRLQMTYLANIQDYSKLVDAYRLFNLYIICLALQKTISMTILTRMTLI